jgi:hypothetical protein
MMTSMVNIPAFHSIEQRYTPRILEIQHGSCWSNWKTRFARETEEAVPYHCTDATPKAALASDIEFKSSPSLPQTGNDPYVNRL